MYYPLSSLEVEYFTQCNFGITVTFSTHSDQMELFLNDQKLESIQKKLLEWRQAVTIYISSVFTATRRNT